MFLWVNGGVRVDPKLGRNKALNLLVLNVNMNAKWLSEDHERIEWECYEAYDTVPANDKRL